MALTVNIPGTATAVIDERDNITINLLVELKDGAVTYDSKTISINVFKHTNQVLNYSVTLMTDEITRYKNNMSKQQQLQNSLNNFTNLVKAQV